MIRLVHVRGHDRLPPARKSLALTPPHLEFVASNDVMGNLLAHAVELKLGRLSPQNSRQSREKTLKWLGGLGRLFE